MKTEFFDYAAITLDKNGYSLGPCYITTHEEHKPGEIVTDPFGHRYKIDFLIRKF